MNDPDMSARDFFKAVGGLFSSAGRDPSSTAQRKITKSTIKQSKRVSPNSHSDRASDSRHFWEKTVEYAFLLDAAAAGKIDYAMPISGKHERAAGDAIFGKDDRYILIEFKRKEVGENLERRKFRNNSNASRILRNRDRHHFYIYSKRDPENNHCIVLEAKTYFSGAVKKGSPVLCLDESIEKEPFFSYLAELMKHREKDGRGEINVEDFECVLGVDAKGRITEAVALKTFLNEFRNELKEARRLTYSANSESHTSTSTSHGSRLEDKQQVKKNSETSSLALAKSNRPKNHK